MVRISCKYKRRSHLYQIWSGSCACLSDIINCAGREEGEGDNESVIKLHVKGTAVGNWKVYYQRQAGRRQECLASDDNWLG
jgi:hypothetical protein